MSCKIMLFVDFYPKSSDDQEEQLMKKALGHLLVQINNLGVKRLA